MLGLLATDIASAIALVGPARVCGDGDRSEKVRSGMGEGVAYIKGEKLLSGSESWEMDDGWALMV